MNKEEGCVKFYRVQCTKGCIDIWYGDSAHNPNSKIKPNWCINSFSLFIRLDGVGEWVYSERRNGIKGFTIEMAEVSTSQEIWNELNRK